MATITCEPVVTSDCVDNSKANITLHYTHPADLHCCTVIFCVRSTCLLCLCILPFSKYRVGEDSHFHFHRVCMQSAILLRQVRLSVCPSHSDIVSKRMHISPNSLNCLLVLEIQPYSRFKIGNCDILLSIVLLSCLMAGTWSAATHASSWFAMLVTHRTVHCESYRRLRTMHCSEQQSVPRISRVILTSLLSRCPVN